MYKIGDIVKVTNTSDDLRVGSYYIITMFYPPWVSETSIAPNCKMSGISLDVASLSKGTSQKTLHSRAIELSSQVNIVEAHLSEVRLKLAESESICLLLGTLLPYWRQNPTMRYCDVLKAVAGDLVKNGREGESLRLLMTSRESKFGYDGGPLCP